MTINKKVTLKNQRISELWAPFLLIFGYDAGFGCDGERLRKIFETLKFSHPTEARNIFAVFRKLRILHTVDLSIRNMFTVLTIFELNSCSSSRLVAFSPSPRGLGREHRHNKSVPHSTQASSTQHTHFARFWTHEFPFRTLSVSVRV